MDASTFEGLGKAYCKKFNLTFLFANASNLSIGFENSKGQQGHIDLDEMTRRLHESEKQASNAWIDVSDIKWDTEQDDGSKPNAKSLGLPTNVKIDIDASMTFNESNNSSEELETLINDSLCCKYGYCVLTCKYIVHAQNKSAEASK